LPRAVACGRAEGPAARVEGHGRLEATAY